MTQPRVSQRDRRALLIGALIAGPSIAYALAVRPLWSAIHEGRQRLTTERLLLAEEKAVSSVAKEYPQVLRENEHELMQEAPRLFDGTDSLVASSQLNEYVATNAVASHVFLQSTESGEIRSDPTGLMTIQMEIHAASDIAGVLAFLRSLEVGTKLIYVSKLTLTPTPSATSYVSTLPQATEVLTLSATISGFALAPPNEGSQ
jgi:hypothetical protein